MTWNDFAYQSATHLVGDAIGGATGVLIYLWLKKKYGWFQ